MINKPGEILAVVLTIVFVVLKLVGVISWAWLWVLSPLWLGFALWLACSLAVLLIVGIIALVAAIAGR